jgi:hypothetical protein
MLEQLFLLDQIPEIRWEHGDDLCDCTFQRIGYWTNPYLARTMEIRMCCWYKALVEIHPELGAFIREIPAFDNYNTNQWETEPYDWSSQEADMPAAIWYRHLSAKTGKPLSEIRKEYAHLNPPRRVSHWVQKT